MMVNFFLLTHSTSRNEGISFIEAEWSSTFHAVFKASRPQSDNESSLAALTDNGDTQ